MEDFGFDINSILTEDEMKEMLDEQGHSDSGGQETGEPEKNEIENNEENEPAEESDNDTSEKVGGEKELEEDAGHQSDGSSPTAFYSSIAAALKNAGIFPDSDDKDIEAVQSADDFAELMEKAVTARLDERQRRIDEALGNGVAPDTIRMYEQTLQYLGSINEEVLSAEGDDGDSLRRQLIYNNLLNHGFSHERAQREVEKSFKAGSDIEDAKDALNELNKYYEDGYENLRNESKKKADEAKAAQKRQSEEFRKMLLDDEVKLGDTKLDKRTCQMIYDAVTKPVWKDPDTGHLLTKVQQFQKQNPKEFIKQIGMWFVLTDGGKDMKGFTKEQVRVDRNKSLRELESKINSSQLDSYGSLRYASRSSGNSDPLLSDGWKVDMSGIKND